MSNKLKSTQRRRVTLDCGNQLVTKQAHKDECDIHKILSQYKKTGIIRHITNRQALYTDLPNSMDYQEAIHMVKDAQNAFSELPSSVREGFNNDPYEFLAALGDPAQREKLQELGVITKPIPSTVIVDGPATEEPKKG